MKRFSELIDNVEGLRFSREARYTCPDCRDAKFVSILHPEMIQALQRDPDTAFERYCVAICHCKQLEKHCGQYRTGVHEGKRIPTFGSADWHIARHEPRARIKAATYVLRPDGFIEAFAEHGQQ